MRNEKFYLKKNNTINSVFKYISLAFFSVFFLIVFKDYTNITSVKYYSFIGLFCLLVGYYLFEKGSLLLDGWKLNKKSGSLSDKFKNGFPYICIALFFVIHVISCVCSPCADVLNDNGQNIFLFGSGRYDGLVVMGMYIVLFVLFSIEGTFGEIHINVLTVTTVLMVIIGYLQLAGLNVFWFFPSGNYYSHDGYFVSTLGNVDVVSTYLCVACSLMAFASIALNPRTWVRILWLIALFVSAVFLLLIDVLAGRVTMVVLFAIALPFMILKKEYLLRFFDVLIVSLMAVLTYIVLQRSGNLVYYSLIISSIFLLVVGKLLLKRFLTDKNLKKYCIAIIVVEILCLIGGIIFLKFFADFDKGIFRQLTQILNGKGKDKYGRTRYGLWKYTLQLIAERPLLGYGVGTYRNIFNEYLQSVAPDFSSMVYDYAHNEYLQIFYDAGALGLISYLAFVSSLIVGAIKRMLLNPKIVVLLFAMIAYLIQACFTFSIIIVSPLFWILAGMLFYEYISLQKDCD